MSINIHIGTSGWSYKHWKEIFYTRETKPTQYLHFYSRNFSVTEINTSFYHLPAIETVENWVTQVPKDFIFCPKMSRYLTHMKKLHDAEEPLQRFFSALKPMQNHLGPILIQLPPFLKFNKEVAAPFFHLLEKKYKSKVFALEIRHASWLEEESKKLMTDHNIACVISQSDNHYPYAEITDTKNIYIRFHGPGALYASSYSDEDLKEYAGKIKLWRAKGHIIWIFFNNDVNGFALKNAEKLQGLLG